MPHSRHAHDVPLNRQVVVLQVDADFDHVRVGLLRNVPQVHLCVGRGRDGRIRERERGKEIFKKKKTINVNLQKYTIVMIYLYYYCYTRSIEMCRACSK